MVVGSVDLIDVTTLAAQHPMRERSRATAFFGAPEAGHWCSAVLVSPNAIMTAAPCVDGDLSGAYAAFRRETGIPQAEWRIYSCQRVLRVDPTLGFAVLECPDRPGDVFGVVEMSRGRFLAAETEVYLLQQACDYITLEECEPTKRLARGLVRVSGPTSFTHDADALPGSMGGPVFERDSHLLVGMHLGGTGDGTLNLGTLATTVADTLDTAPELELGRRPSIFGGPPLPPDPFEPNQDTMTATEINESFESSETWIAENDLDVFKVEAQANQRIRVQLEFAHALGDIDVAIRRDSLDGPRVASAVSATDDELITYQVQRPSAYYVVVYGYQGATNEYRISLDVR